MRDQVPLDSLTIAALRGVTLAAMHAGDMYPVAVEHWTRGLTRGELTEVICLLGALLTMQAPGGGTPS